MVKLQLFALIQLNSQLFTDAVSFQRVLELRTKKRIMTTGSDKNTTTFPQPLKQSEKRSYFVNL